jgi:hypothetical protein
VAATMKTIGICLHPVGAFLLGAITRADIDQALRPRASARRRAVRAGARVAAA